MSKNKEQNKKFISVAIIGLSNVGKSTLMNEMIGAKISIVTHKVQTTRARVIGIAVKDETQIVFIDTPGIFAPKKTLDKAMVSAAWSAMQETHLTMLMIDVTKPDHPELKKIMQRLKQENMPAILVLNKVDKLKNKDDLLTLAEKFDQEKIFDRIFMISALKGRGVEDIQKYLVEKSQEGDWPYPEDQVADLPERLLAAEITREELMLNLHDELPYHLTVETEKWEDFKNGDVKLNQIIYISTPQHKPIILGKNGQTLKKIRERAQAQLQEIFDRKFHLFIHVKISENWAEQSTHLQAMGLNPSK